MDPCYLGGKTRFKRLNAWVVRESVSHCSSEGIRNVHLLKTRSADQSFFLFFFSYIAVRLRQLAGGKWFEYLEWQDAHDFFLPAPITREKKKFHEFSFYSKSSSGVVVVGKIICLRIQLLKARWLCPLEATVASPASVPSSMIGVFLRLTRDLGQFGLSWTDTVEY